MTNIRQENRLNWLFLSILKPDTTEKEDILQLEF